MRKVFGPIAVTVIIGAIAMVFVFYGVYNPRTTKGMGEGALAATVNGDSISMQEFGREYQQRVEFYQNMMKGKADANLLKQLGLKQQVVEELIRRKLMLQEAKHVGMTVSDEEVRDKIRELPYFKKDGKFDAMHYEAVLAANRYSPAAFEESVREDLLRNRISEFMRTRARVSDNEVEKEFLTSEDRRQVDYVFLGREYARKMLIVGEKEADDFLKDEKNIEMAKMHYEQNKMAYMKNPPKEDKKKKDAKTPPPKPEYFSFDEVKKKVAIDVLKDRRQEEMMKINKDMAAEVLAKAKGPAAQYKAFLKTKGLELKASDKFNRLSGFVAGIGEVPELIEDAFRDKSPLAEGPKLYESRANFVIAQDLKAFKPDMANFSKEREKLVQQATMRKEQAIYEQWMGDLRSKAKVSINKSLNQIDEAAE